MGDRLALPATRASRSVACLIALLLGGAAAYGSWWGGRLIALGCGPGRSDGFPFLALGGAWLFAALMGAMAAWWLIGYARRARSPRGRRAFLLLIILLPGAAGLLFTLAQLLADGVSPSYLLRGAIPNLAVLLLLLGVGWLLRAAARPISGIAREMNRDET